MLIFYIKNRENIKTPNYNNLAHLPIIIPSITRVATTNRIRTMFTNKTATTNTTTITPPIRSAFNNNNGIGTVIHALSNIDQLTSSTNVFGSASSTTSSPSYSALDDNNGNTNNNQTPYAMYTIQKSTITMADDELNGNAINDAYDNNNGNIRMKLLTNRNRSEIRITENPIAETIVC